MYKCRYAHTVSRSFVQITWPDQIYTWRVICCGLKEVVECKPLRSVWHLFLVRSVHTSLCIEMIACYNPKQHRLALRLLYFISIALLWYATMSGQLSWQAERKCGVEFEGDQSFVNMNHNQQQPSQRKLTSTFLREHFWSRILQHVDCGGWESNHHPLTGRHPIPL